MSFVYLWWAISAAQAEPGYLKSKILNAKSATANAVLTTEFAKAKGLSSDDVRALHYNRVGCNRRIYSPSGQSVEGDADIRVTKQGADFYEVDFPSRLAFHSFGALSPFGNGVADLESVTARQLLNLKTWPEGKSLVMRKKVSVSFKNENLAPKTLDSMMEMKIIPGTYPKLFLVREVIFTQPKMILYYLCD